MATSKTETYLVTFDRDLDSDYPISIEEIEQRMTRIIIANCNFIEESSITVQKQRKANIRTIKGGRRQSDPIHYVQAPTGDNNEQK